MEFKVKTLDWNAGIPVAMLNQKTASKMGFYTKDMISLRTMGKNPKEFSTIVDIIKGIVKEDEIGISLELKKALNLKSNQKVDVNVAVPPESINFIKKKLNKKRFSQEEIDTIIGDVVNNSLSEAEIALFISAMYESGMNMKETIYLIKAIQKTGSHMDLKEKFVVDKHSIGGVPGNRTTPIVVSICAATGLTFPKTSSRAITSAAGTADVMETIANVEFQMKDLKKIIQKTRAFIVWGGAIGMVPADSKIIRVEKMLKIDPLAQLLASVMSKKLAVGSKYILIDIPYGKGAKVNKIKAFFLKRKFEALGRHFHKKLKCFLTDGSQPIGKGVGPALEIKDVISVLDPSEKGPEDLRKKSVFLAGKLFEMTGKAKKGKGIQLAEEVLNNGKAFEKFKEIVKAQGGNINKIKSSKFQKTIVATKNGKVKEIKNKSIVSLARLTGCPLDKSCGLYIHVANKQKIKKNQKIITIHANSKTRLNKAVKYFREEKPILIR